VSGVERNIDQDSDVVDCSFIMKKLWNYETRH
jgi:hypothetical protein